MNFATPLAAPLLAATGPCPGECERSDHGERGTGARCCTRSSASGVAAIDDDEAATGSLTEQP
jgi:hypothetical protein